MPWAFLAVLAEDGVLQIRFRFWATNPGPAPLKRFSSASILARRHWSATSARVPLRHGFPPLPTGWIVEKLTGQVPAHAEVACVALSEDKFNQGMSTQEYIQQIKVNKQPFVDVYDSVEIPEAARTFFDGLNEPCGWRCSRRLVRRRPQHHPSHSKPGRQYRAPVPQGVQPGRGARG